MEITHKDSPWKILVLGVILLLVAEMLRPILPKMRPGGPYLSLTGEIIPFCLFIFSIMLIIRDYKIRTIPIKLFSILVIGFWTFYVGKIVLDAISFWNDPYSRGILFGW